MKNKFENSLISILLYIVIIYIIFVVADNIKEVVKRNLSSTDIIKFDKPYNIKGGFNELNHRNKV